MLTMPCSNAFRAAAASCLLKLVWQVAGLLSCFAKNWRWVGSALFIAGFIGCIVWSFGVYWPLSLGLSVLFILILTIWVRRFHESLQSSTEARVDPKDNSVARIEPRDAEHQPQPEIYGPSAEPDCALQSGSIRIPLTLSILYIVLVFSTSIPGAILSLKAIPCYEYYEHTGNKGKHRPTIPRGQSFWTTDNFQDLPSGVRSWVDVIAYPYGAETSHRIQIAGYNRFCKVGDTTYFEGKFAHETSTSLMSTSGVAPASKVGPFYEPTWITQVTNTTCCFMLKKVSMTRDFSRVVCGNNNKGFDRYVSLAYVANPAFFTEIDGLLWFVQTDEKDEYSQNLHAVCSLNVTTMDLAVYIDTKPNVTIEEDPDDDDDDTKTHLVKRNCDSGDSTAGQVGGLFMSAMPVVITSIWLWKKGIPSSSFTLYVGLGFVCQFTTAAFDSFSGFEAWFTIGTPVWILVTAFVIAVNKTAQRHVLYFGLYSISSFAVLFMLSGLVVHSVTDDFLTVNSQEVEVWFMMTVLAFIPLILVGILVKSSYIYVLGIVGVGVVESVAIFRLSHLGIVVSFLIWVAAILVLILMGFAIHRKREIVHYKIASGLTRCVGHKHEKADAGECAGLLPN